MKINFGRFIAHHAVETNALVSLLGTILENMALSPVQKALANEALGLLAVGAQNLAAHAATYSAATETVQIVADPFPLAEIVNPETAPLAPVVIVAEPTPPRASDPDPAPVNPAAVAAATSQAQQEPVAAVVAVADQVAPVAGETTPAAVIAAPAGQMDGTLQSPAEIAAANAANGVEVVATGTVDGEPVEAVAAEPVVAVDEFDPRSDDQKWIDLGYRFDPFDGRPLVAD